MITDDKYMPKLLIVVNVGNFIFKMTILLITFVPGVKFERVLL